MEKMEPYTVEIPERLELKASGVKIAEFYKDGLTIYVQDMTQRIFVPDMIDGITQYAKRLNFGMEYIIFDPEYDRFEFRLKPLPPVMTPRKISDNPQA
jgi:hypothetical protein